MLLRITSFSKNSFTIASIVIFVAGLVSYSVAKLPRNTGSKLEAARAFTLISFESGVDSKGVKQVHALRILEVDANGNQILTKYPINQNGHNEWSKTEVTKENIIRSDSSGKFATSPQPFDPQKMAELHDKWRTEAFYKNHREFVRTEEILGLEVFILRSQSQKRQDEWTETAFSPKTGIVPLRFIKHHSDGSEIVIEPIKIEFR